MRLCPSGPCCILREPWSLGPFPLCLPQPCRSLKATQAGNPESSQGSSHTWARPLRMCVRLCVGEPSHQLSKEGVLGGTWGASDEAHALTMRAAPLPTAGTGQLQQHKASEGEL